MLKKLFTKPERLYNEGYNDGKQDGYQQGYEDGIESLKNITRRVPKEEYDKAIQWLYENNLCFTYNKFDGGLVLTKYK